MAKADIWMPLYIGDYLADTMHLTCEQHGAYMLLLMAYWRKGAPLPSSDMALAAICRLSVDAWSIHKAVLMQFFDASSGTAWVHRRVEKEMAEAVEKKGKAVEKAKKAAEAKWNKARECLEHDTSNAKEVLDICPSPSPSPSPTQNIHIEKPPLPGKSDNCPHQAIVDLYHEILPELARVKDLTEKRQKHLRARWRSDSRFQALDWWRRYFSHVRGSPFLMGAKTDFQAGFDFLIKPDSFQKVLEGVYHRG